MSNIVIKGNIVKIGKILKRVPKDKTCVIRGFEFGKDGKVLRNGETFFTDRMYIDGIGYMVSITKCTFHCTAN